MNNLKGEAKKPLLTFIVVDSRSDEHPNWVGQCIQSIENQIEKVELIIVGNLNRTKTIGKCFNQGVKAAKGEWCVFVGDDDFVAYDYSRLLREVIESDKIQKTRVVNVATYMTAFKDGTEYKTALARQSTGAWKRDYLLKYPFNENLKTGIDREYIEETVKRGDLITIIEYYFGYFYRKHDSYSCAGDIIFEKEPSDYYFITSNRVFLNQITERIKGKVFIDNKLTPELALNAKTIWVEWANEKAVEAAEFKTKAKKILRIHAYEAFSDTIKKIDLNKFDTVIFVSEYIKNYVEKQYGKINGAVVIPNGIDFKKFTLDKKIRNNKIAFAGYLTRKKGIGEVILLAESLPEYEFCLAGKYQEDDICDFLNQRKPDNLNIENWQYDINEWYQDKTFILNTSLRESQAMSVMEGMACGLKPLVRNWIGSDIYEKTWKSVNDLKELLEEDYEPLKYRSYVKKFDIEKIFPNIEELIYEHVPE